MQISAYKKIINSVQSKCWKYQTLELKEDSFEYINLKKFFLEPEN